MSVPRGSGDHDHQHDVHGLQEQEKELELFSQRRKTEEEALARLLQRRK